jgi:hypothetical protein
MSLTGHKGCAFLRAPPVGGVRVATIHSFEEAQARASAAGLGTSAGHSQSSGQRSESQLITPSYFRAVKVVEPSTTRSKKRQSPAAKRPKVVKLRPLASAYAEAQAMRFERNSVSIAEDNSRSFPTTQALKVGNIQLADCSDLSDKSAMREVDRIRQRIQKALNKAGLSPFTLARELKWDRHHLAEYLSGKKDSLKVERLMVLSERLGIPFNELIPGGSKKETG